jgi:hypothetical protein
MTDYSPISLDRHGDGWLLRINGFSDAAVVSAYIWPGGAPQGVHVTMLEAVTEPAVVGDFEITGVDEAAMSAMDPWWEVYFAQDPAAPATGGGSSGGGAPENEFVVRDAGGNVLYQGAAEPMVVQGLVESLGPVERLALEAALETAIAELKAEASSLGATLAAGIQAGAAAAIGLDAGAGCYVGPDGELGWYHSLGLDFGFALGAAVEAIGAGVKGGPDNFAGRFRSVTVAGGEFAVGGITALYAMDSGEFMGLAVHAGVGVGFPVAVYMTWSNTWLHPA